MSAKEKNELFEFDNEKEKNDNLSKSLDKFARYFSIVTYALDYDLKRILKEHDSSIRSYCYIKHDKDHSPAHFHILLYMFSSWRSISVLRWFDDLVDRDGNSVNTFIEVARSFDSLIPYLLHDTFEARSAGKEPYEQSKLVFKNRPVISPRKDCVDSSYNVLFDMIRGVSTIDLVKKYGRDFVYHYHHFVDVSDRIISECSGSSLVAQKFMDEYKEVDPVNIDNFL